MTSKASEADELIKKAQKWCVIFAIGFIFSLKTSILKWSPDIDSAIDYYTKAAVIYRNLKRLQDSADIYIEVLASFSVVTFRLLVFTRRMVLISTVLSHTKPLPCYSATWVISQN